MTNAERVLEALGDRTRRRIFVRLRNRACYAGDLARGNGSMIMAYLPAANRIRNASSMPSRCQIGDGETARRERDFDRCIDRYEQAITLYRGEFMQGSYEPWVDEQRTYYREQYLRMLEALASVAETALLRRRLALAGSGRCPTCSTCWRRPGS